jgi:aspartate/methionine/tyrosine aminotransferase
MDDATPPVARRARETQMPLIPAVAEWIAETPGTISLGQGVVRFRPPAEVMARIPRFLTEFPHNLYVHDPGTEELRRAFEEKLSAENGIRAPFERRIVVTAGANQAFVNAVLAVCDPGDEVILLSPYYFNHEMAVTLAGCRPVPVPTGEDHLPRPEAIRDAITARTRMVVTVSPNNPTGAVYPKEILAEINALCALHGVYHVSDEAYEYFTYGGAEHFSPGSLGNDDFTISLFSLSKSLGMASWRVGFMAIPDHLYEEVLKIQDTVIVCAPAISQFVAREALPRAREYARSHLPSLDRVRVAVTERLSELDGRVTVPPAEGAFYLFPEIRTAESGVELAERLVREHGVAVMPGETFGARGRCRLRISYGALDEATALEGIERLARGLEEILP